MNDADLLRLRTAALCRLIARIDQARELALTWLEDPEHAQYGKALLDTLDGGYRPVKDTP